MTELSIFVSSPGDVAEERSLASRVIDRLGKEFGPDVALTPIFWEHEPLTASSTFQDQLVRPSDTDIVVCILWSRLGTRLPAQFTREDGSRYDSGTEYEFEDALAGYEKNGRPHLLVYRKTAEPLVSLQNPDELLEKLRQKQALDEFINRWFHDRDEGTLRAAFHSFESPDVFEETLSVHLRKLIRRLLPSTGEAKSSQRRAWTKGSPFRGLEAFDVDHADVFFGRTKASSDVVEHLRAQDQTGRPFVLILGMSGGGKSSLARAGVLALLTRPGVVEGVTEWSVGIAKPSDADGDPFLALAEAIKSACPGLAEQDQALHRRLGTAPETVAAEIEALLTLDADGRHNLILLVDQLEELFTNPSLTADDRTRFAHAVRVLAESGVWILATMRSDLYPRLQETPDLMVLKEGQGTYDLSPPSPSEIAQMIRQPVLAAGLSLESDPESGESLEDALKQAAVGRPGSLPLLEFTLEELYRTRRDDGTLTLEAFREMGGVEGSLARRAEGVFSELPVEVQKAFADTMRHLITVSEGPDGTSVGAGRADLSRVASNAHSRSLVEALVDARLLTTELSGDGSAAVRIAHEAILRHWPRLSTWIQEDQELLTSRTRLRGAAFRWAEEGKRDEFLLAQGKPLYDAQSVLRAGISLTQLEEAFLEASEYRARRFTRVRRGAVAVMILLSAFAIGSSIVATNQAGRAQRETYASLQVQDFMVGLLELASPRISQGSDVTVTELLDWGGQALLRGELEDTPLPRARAARSLAELQLDLGGSNPAADGTGYTRALALVRLADSIQSSLPLPHDSTQAATWTLMGEVFNARAAYDSAAAYLERGRSAWAPISPAHEAEALGSLALVRRRQGREGEYLELVQRATDLALSAHDSISGDFASALTNYGSLLVRQERFTEADAVLERAGSIWRDLGHQQTPSYGEYLGFVAESAAAQGLYQTADSLWEEALTLERVVLPEGHEGLAMTLNNTALNAQLVGDTVRSEAYLREALALSEAALGTDHNRVAQVRNNLAELLIHRPETREESDSLFNLAISTLRETNPGSSDLTASLQNFAEALRLSGRIEQALPYLDEAVSLEYSQERSAAAAMAETRRGLFLLRMDRQFEATAGFRRAIAAAEGSEPPDAAARRLAELQQIFWNFDQLAVSESAARRALVVLQNQSPDANTGRAHGDMAFWHAFHERTDSARLSLTQALSDLDGAPRPLGTLWLRANQAARDAMASMELYDERVARDQAVLAELEAEDQNPQWILAAKLRLGASYADAGDIERARELLEAVATESEALLGPQHPLTQEARAILGQN